MKWICCFDCWQRRYEEPILPALDLPHKSCKKTLIFGHIINPLLTSLFSQDGRILSSMVFIFVHGLVKLLHVLILLIIYELSHKWTAEMKWKWRNYRSSERNLCNCIKKPEKIRTSTGFEPVTSRLPVRCSNNWAIKPLTLGAGQLWVQMFPWKKRVLMIYEINHIWTAEHLNPQLTCS